MKTTCPSDQDEVTHQDSEAKDTQSGWPSLIRVQIQRIKQIRSFGPTSSVKGVVAQ